MVYIGRHKSIWYWIQRLLVIAVNAIVLAIHFSSDQNVFGFRTFSPRDKIQLYHNERLSATRHISTPIRPFSAFHAYSGSIRKGVSKPRFGKSSCWVVAGNSDLPETVEVRIGVECHCQVDCSTKAFCPCPAPTSSQGAPNTRMCHVCMGEPGALPMLNKALVAAAIRAGSAFNCEIADTVAFDRKLYFYPDTPKNYQITQHRHPIARRGLFRMLSGDIITSCITYRFAKFSNVIKCVYAIIVPYTCVFLM
jgi:hypothetical protein